MVDQNEADRRSAEDRAAAAKKLEEATRKRLTEEKERREKLHASQHSTLEGVKPTPTQEENDLAASGVKVELEPDGSPEQPPVPPEPPPEGGGVTRTTRQVEADKSRPGYTTRSPEPPKAS